MADVSFRDKNRHRSSIMAEVLEIAKESTIKTHIMYKATLSYTQLIKHLSFLLDRNLLEVVKTSGKTTYKTTDKGLRYLWHYREIEELLNGGKRKQSERSQRASLS